VKPSLKVELSSVEDKHLSIEFSNDLHIFWIKRRTTEESREEVFDQAQQEQSKIRSCYCHNGGMSSQPASNF
jgi:hypothetical protein